MGRAGASAAVGPNLIEHPRSGLLGRPDPACVTHAGSRAPALIDRLNLDRPGYVGVTIDAWRYKVDVTRILEADHRQVEDLFDRIEKAKGADRRPLVDELATALRAHMELEETILYPAMRPVTGKEAVQEANTEHELGRKSLEDVLRLAPDEPGFGAALDATKAGIAHHVHEEENEVFTELRKDGQSVLEQIATPFMRKRMELARALVTKMS
jgi:hemerythrin superfamily protein